MEYKENFFFIFIVSELNLRNQIHLVVIFIIIINEYFSMKEVCEFSFLYLSTVLERDFQFIRNRLIHLNYFNNQKIRSHFEVFLSQKNLIISCFLIKLFWQPFFKH